MHSRVLSLRQYKGRPIIDYGLGLKIVRETPQDISIDLPTGIVTLNKYQYLNKDKIYDAGDKLFFMICNKQVKKEYVLEKLIEYALSKVDDKLAHLKSRVEVLEDFKMTLKKEVAA